jgi:hypothetical protein
MTILTPSNAFPNRNVFCRGQKVDADQMVATGLPDVNTFSALTMSGWFIPGFSGGSQFILGGDNAYVIMACSTQSASPIFYRTTSSPGAFAGLVGIGYPSPWHHAAMTSPNGAGGTTIGYLDGAFDGSIASGDFHTTTAWVGLAGLRGSVADLAIWNIVLTPTQIAQLAAGKRANTVGANANLVAYWPIVGASPEPDLSGNGYNMALTGTILTANPPPLKLQSLSGGIAFPQHL